MSNNICIHTINAVSFLWYGAIKTTVYRQNTNIEKMNVWGSELRKFWHFYILKLRFLSIFCRYMRYFVGTNDMLVGLHVPTNFQMYRQKSEKALLAKGNCPPAPPPPPPPPPAMLINGCDHCREDVRTILRTLHFLTFVLKRPNVCSRNLCLNSTLRLITKHKLENNRIS